MRSHPAEKLRNDIRDHTQRSPNQIIRGLAAGHIDPRSLTHDEETKVHRCCARVVRIQLARIAEDVSARRFRIARKRQHKFIACLPARLLTAARAIQKKASSRTIADVRFSRTWALAERLRHITAPSVAKRWSQRKSNGEYRNIYSFDDFGIALQQLIAMAIRPFASFHSSQFMLRRGRSAACEALLAAMNGAVSDNTRFIQFDVRRFFDSISHRWVEENLPLPKAIIRNTVLLEGWTIVPQGLTRPLDEACREMGQREGIPQGSAVSSLVSEIVMADVLRTTADFPEGVIVITYSDNLGMLVPNDVNISALEESLRGAFRVHPAGPFQLHTTGATPIFRPFRFLGYSWVRNANGQASAYLSDAISQLRELEVLHDLLDAETVQQSQRIASKLKSYCSAFSLWDGAADMQNRLTDLISKHIDYLERRDQGHKPPIAGASSTQFVSHPAFEPARGTLKAKVKVRKLQSFERNTGHPSCKLVDF
jgi:RNA-directed DNA polymerase